LKRPTNPFDPSDSSAQRKPTKLSAASFDDLPEAVRERSDLEPLAKRPLKRWRLAWAGILVGAVAVVGLVRSFQVSEIGFPKSAPYNTEVNPTDGTLLGHYAFTEAPAEDLESVSADGGIQLRKAAAQAYKALVSAAQADGISIAPLSGFRSIKEQEDVFLRLKQERSQTTSERANVSAPPGYSEHHTGYAIDVGDGQVPATNLSPDFEGTAAFKWLETHATQYNFELSFTKGNRQGVTYEPWHWRYVGDRNSLETFFKSRGK